MTEEELLNFTELDEVSFSPLLLDFPDFSLELDYFTSLRGSLDEDFAFSLLDEVTSSGSVTLPLLEEDDSTPGSSFGPADADDESPQAARNASNTEVNK